MEVKKATESEEVYRGKGKKSSVSELKKNTEYNVRVKCVVGELQGMWSDVTAFKTNNLTIDSAILSKKQIKKFLIRNYVSGAERSTEGHRIALEQVTSTGCVTTKGRHLSLLRTQVDMCSVD